LLVKSKIKTNPLTSEQEWIEIGRRSPQLPQMFYPATNKNVKINKDDILAARCTMFNFQNKTVSVGYIKIIIYKVILSNFRRARTVPNSNFLLKIHWEQSTYRTIVLFLKTRVFSKQNHKVSQKTHYFMVFFQKNPSF